MHIHPKAWSRLLLVQGGQTLTEQSAVVRTLVDGNELVRVALAAAQLLQMLK
jgi:hypothetical protein